MESSRAAGPPNDKEHKYRYHWGRKSAPLWDLSDANIWRMLGWFQSLGEISGLERGSVRGPGKA